MTRSFVLSAVCAALMSMAGVQAFAQTAAKPAKTSAKTTAKPVADAVTVSLNDSQLQIAPRVLTGDAQCEFNQHVSVAAIAGKPGHFAVGFKNVTYTMVPEATTTGAVRLEDKKAGVVWVQIPSKSMLLNSKIGQRMVDACTVSQQRTSL
jgi:hypothetical protein